MRKIFNTFIFVTLFTAIVFLVLGFMIMFNPMFPYTTVSYGVAFLFFVIKRVFVYNYKSSLLKTSFLTLGTVCMLFSCILIIYPDSFEVALPITLGIWMIMNSMINVQLSASLKKVRHTTWILSTALSIISIVYGLLVIIKPQFQDILYSVFLGTMMSMYAVSTSMNLLIFSSNYKKVVKLIKE